MYRIDKNIEIESRLMVAKSWKEERMNANRESFGGDKNVLELDNGNDCLILWQC